MRIGTFSVLAGSGRGSLFGGANVADTAAAADATRKATMRTPE
jgi:hypothetical protein